jgi:uncharacterized protein YndB with AHSA1/START domain
LNDVKASQEKAMPKIHQELTFAAPPVRVYRALVDSAQHAKFTGAPAEIGAAAGDAWSAYGGQISGRHVELVEGSRVVQTWRAGNWPDGVHSIVRFELTPAGAGTRVILDHDALPDDLAQHIDGGWKTMYWEPLRKYLEA